MAITYHSGRRIQVLSTDLTESIRQGYDGGNGYNSEPYLGGGGGGAGEVGESISSGTTCATGGDGLQSDIWQGNSIYYAGGGGATSVRNSTTGGAGGQGGGGAAGSASNGVAGTDYLGGGGGATWDVGYGGAGGKGVVILQFTTSGTSFSTTGSPSSDTSVSGKTTLKYTSTGTFVISSGTPDVRYLVIGGGGGGCSGGGGAGGFRTGTLSLSSSTGSSGTHTVTVGTGSSGGNGGSNTPATNGLDSVFDTITSIGGGGGGGAGSGSGLTGGTGGSGGGAGKDGTVGSGTLTVNDLKPANVQVGSRMEETDTRNIYHFADPLTFEDDFSSNSGWVYTGTISYNASGYQNLNFARDGSNNGCYYDLTTVSDSAWVLRAKMHLTTKSTSSQNSFIGLTNTTSGSNSSQDAIGMFFIAVSNTISAVDCNGQTIASGGNGDISFTTTNGNDYWVQITRLTTTTMRVEIFDNANYTGTASITINSTIPSGITGLRYLKMQNREELGNNSTSDVWTGDDVKFYNGVTSTGNVWSEEGT